MSHIDTFDVKESNKNVTSTRSKDGEHVANYLSKTAKIMDKVTSINSMSSTTGDHGGAQYLLHHSYTSQAGANHPSIGAWILKEAGRINKTLPGYITVGGNGNGGSGFLGGLYSAMPVGSPEGGVQNAYHHKSVSEADFDKKISMLDRLNKNFLNKLPSQDVKSYSELYKETANFMRSKDLEAFDINQEPESITSRYLGNSDRASFASGCILARRLVEQGVRYVEVQLKGWDTHSNNFESVAKQCATLDSAYAALIQDLDSRGMLASTLVVLATEFGRKPKIDDRGGRGHHPGAYTALLAGGGVQGGLRYGKTDASGGKVIENKVTPSDLNATIAHCSGVDYAQKHFDQNRRLFKVAGETAQPIFDILA